MNKQQQLDLNIKRTFICAIFMLWFYRAVMQSLSKLAVHISTMKKSLLDLCCWFSFFLFFSYNIMEQSKVFSILLVKISPCSLFAITIGMVRAQLQEETVQTGSWIAARVCVLLGDCWGSAGVVLTHFKRSIYLPCLYLVRLQLLFWAGSACYPPFP